MRQISLAGTCTVIKLNIYGYEAESEMTTKIYGYKYEYKLHNYRA